MRPLAQEDSNPEKQAEAGLTEKTAETDSAESTVQTSPADKRPDEASAGTEKPEEKAEKNV